MNELYELKEYANKFSYILNMGSIATVRERPMRPDEQGFSGAAMIRLDVIFNNGHTGSFVCKKTDLKERMVMQTLTEQGHAYTPASYSEDCVSNEPMWMIQQDLGKRVSAPYDNLQWMEKVADALAEIHGNNMNHGKKMLWLPQANAEYWNKIVTQISVDHFERAVYEDRRFAEQFGAYLPKLRDVGNAFARDMTALSEETQWLTLTHGDLQNIEGDHVYNIQGKPYIIDFGFARYAPFYIDLVDYFSFKNAVLYHKALKAKGFTLNLTDFEERFRAAYRYPCFIYMFPSIMQWKNGSENRLLKLLHRMFSYS